MPHRDLDSDASFKVLYAPKAKSDYRPFAWQRGKLTCAVNPAGAAADLPLKLKDGTRVLYAIGEAARQGRRAAPGRPELRRAGVNRNMTSDEYENPRSERKKQFMSLLLL